MTHEELIEKVARELCLSDGMEPDDEVIAGQAAGYENFGPRFQSAERSQNMCGNRNYMEDARVAISTILAALQDPTEEMIIAGGNYVLSVGSIDCMHVDDRPEYGMTGRETGSYALFQAMLNASPLVK